MNLNSEKLYETLFNKRFYNKKIKKYNQIRRKLYLAVYFLVLHLKIQKINIKIRSKIDNKI